MRAACLRVGQVVNQTALGRDVALSQSTVHRYLNLLETSQLLVRVPAYSVNRTRRLIKSPKLYWADTGIAMHLAGQTEPTGAHLENLVLQDLLAWRDTRTEPTEISYWRTASGARGRLRGRVRRHAHTNRSQGHTTPQAPRHAPTCEPSKPNTETSPEPPYYSTTAKKPNG